jgi:4-amino-4-deoxy-L-arabinose transferase-like glycosyltransferase
MAMAFVVRLIALDSRTLWYDDVFSLFLARQEWGAIVSGTAADTMPPLYYFLLSAWRGLGETAFSLRFLSVSLSMLVTAGVYRTAAKLFSARAGLFAALLTAVSPLQVYHAQELRMYGLLALALLAYLYCFVVFYRAAQRGEADYRALAGLTLAGAAALYTHNLAFVTLAAASVYLAWKRAWRPLMALGVAQGASAALFIPWALYLPGQVDKIQRAFWTLPPSWPDVLQTVVVFTTNLPLDPGLLTPALFVSLAGVCLAGIALARARGRNEPAVSLPVVMALVPPAMLFALSYVIRPVFVPRGFILSSLIYYMLLGQVVAGARPLLRGVALAGLALVMLPALAYQYTYAEFPRSPFREANAFLAQAIRPGDALVHDNKLTFFPMQYYDPELPHNFLADPAGSSNDTLARGSMEAMDVHPVEIEKVRGEGRVWLVIFERAIAEAEENEEGHGNLTWFDAHFKRAGWYRFNDLAVVLYEKLD